MSENVVTSGDIVPKKVPTSFKDLKKPELLKAAEYFGTDTEGNVDALLADLAESGVTFESYLAAFYPDEKPTPEPEKFEMPAPVDIEDWPDAEEGGEEVTEIVTAAPAPELNVAEKYLIKFVGDNPYFEFGKYKFTTDKPYGIMPAKDAQKALVSEPTKFRQAYPAELEEFYS